VAFLVVPLVGRKNETAQGGVRCAMMAAKKVCGIEGRVAMLLRLKMKRRHRIRPSAGRRDNQKKL
jgi:hypothetical protein